MILVDTSSWIHFLRPDGDPKVRARVDRALRSGEACWCPLVQLELWTGARGACERETLRDFARVLPELSIDGEAWTKAYELATGALDRGVTVPATDILIAACGLRHGVESECADSRFDHLVSNAGRAGSEASREA